MMSKKEHMKESIKLYRNLGYSLKTSERKALNDYKQYVLHNKKFEELTKEEKKIIGK